MAQERGYSMMTDEEILVFMKALFSLLESAHVDLSYGTEDTCWALQIDDEQRYIVGEYKDYTEFKLYTQSGTLIKTFERL